MLHCALCAKTFLYQVIFANQWKIAQSRQLSRESVGYCALYWHWLALKPVPDKIQSKKFISFTSVALLHQGPLKQMEGKALNGLGVSFNQNFENVWESLANFLKNTFKWTILQKELVIEVIFATHYSQTIKSFKIKTGFQTVLNLGSV